MRVLVTGASGFAGRHLLRHLLERGDAPLAWARAPCPELEDIPHRFVDVTDAQACARAMQADAPEALIHLAALTHLGDAEADPERAWAVNVQGTTNVLRALPEGCPALLASSAHVYGPPARLPLTEDHLCAPRGVYARSKLAGEEAALLAHPATVIARAFHHTGPGQSPRYAFPDWARQLAARRAEGRQDPLQVGDVELRRDYCDVRDVVAGYRLLLERAPPGAVVNLCSGEAPSLRALLTAMMGAQPVPLAPDPARLRGAELRELRGDPRLAESLGWRRRHRLADTLQEMLRLAAREAQFESGYSS